MIAKSLYPVIGVAAALGLMLAGAVEAQAQRNCCCPCGGYHPWGGIYGYGPNQYYNGGAYSGLQPYYGGTGLGGYWQAGNSYGSRGPLLAPRKGVTGISGGGYNYSWRIAPDINEFLGRLPTTGGASSQARGQSLTPAIPTGPGGPGTGTSPGARSGTTDVTRP